jgi:hypothetical protein
MNVVVLIVSSLIVFANNAPLTFVGYDGRYNFLKIGLQMKWMPGGMSFANNPLQEMGNIFMSHNIWLLPGYVLGGLIGDIATAAPVIYTANAVIGFLCVCALGRLLHLPPLSGLAAAWVLALLAMPFFWPIPLYAITGMVPHYLQIIAVAALMVGCFFAIGRTSRAASVALTIALFVLAYVSAAAAPALFTLAAPIFLLFGTAYLVVAERGERKAKFVAVVVLVAAAAPGVLPFLAGTLLNSVPFFFKNELITFQGGWANVGMVFSSQTWRGGPYFFAFSMAGCLLAAVWGGRTLRATAVATLLGVALLFGAGALFNTVMQPLVGLRDLEIFLWPFYALFTGLFLAFLWRLLTPMGARGWGWGGRALLLMPAMAAVTLSFSDEGKSNWSPWPFPPEEDGLVQTLREEISLSDNPHFRGMVATFTGFHKSNDAITWMRLVSLDHQLHHQSGNDYRAQGLWYFDIPTLFGYNQLMTPQFYLMTSRLLARPTDRQMRNVIVLSQVNVNYLRSVGVRFVITDYPLQSVATEVILRQQTTIGDVATLFLYELSDPNLGTYSPTEAVVFETTASAIDAFRKPDFDFRQRVAVMEAVAADLNPAAVESVEVSRMGMRVKASSPGASLLVLPLQFSRCLDLNANGEGAAARLVRANFMQTGLLFTGRIDATIRFSYGPHRNAWCRLKDSREFAALAPARAH